MGTFLEYFLPRTFGLQKTSFVLGFRIFIVLLFLKKNAGNPNRLSRQHRPSACKALHIYMRDNLEKTTVIWHFHFSLDRDRCNKTNNQFECVTNAQSTNKTMTNCWWQRRSTHADNYHFQYYKFHANKILELILYQVMISFCVYDSRTDRMRIVWLNKSIHKKFNVNGSVDKLIKHVCFVPF